MLRSPHVRFRRRIRFAAPWIVVIGCSSPGRGGPDRVTTGAPGTRIDASVGDTRERGAAAAADATMADAGAIAATPEPCWKWKPDPSNPPCNPPKPAAIEARILAVAVAGSALEVSVDRGSDDRVEKGWIGEVLDEAGKAIPNLTGVVGRVAGKTSQLRIRTTQLPTGARKVRLFPPR